MPQTKNEKRKTAVRLYSAAMQFHRRSIHSDSSDFWVKFHEQKIEKLQNHVTQTEAKIEIGA